MSFYSIAHFIEENYPQYYSIESYPVENSAPIRKVKDEWGLLCNFAPTPITINGVIFKNAEQLFQCMKFCDPEPLKAIYNAPQPKYPAKHWEKTHRRSDWGQIIVDAMKFCLNEKCRQSQQFRQTLISTGKRYIVEDQTSFPKKSPDTWGVKLRESSYVGPNLLGRLLMELRDNGALTYTLPSGLLTSITDILSADSNPQ